MVSLSVVSVTLFYASSIFFYIFFTESNCKESTSSTVASHQSCSTVNITLCEESEYNPAYHPHASTPFVLPPSLPSPSNTLKTPLFLPFSNVRPRRLVVCQRSLCSFSFVYFPRSLRSSLTVRPEA